MTWCLFLSDIRIVIPACFLANFLRVFSFYPFSLRWLLYLKNKWVSCRKQKVIFWFLTHSSNLFIFIRKWILLIIKITIGRCVLIALICFFICFHLLIPMCVSLFILSFVLFLYSIVCVYSSLHFKVFLLLLSVGFVW